MTKKNLDNNLDNIFSAWATINESFLKNREVQKDNIDSIEKKIRELKSVENWLNMNLDILKATIQGMEMNLISLKALRGTDEEARGQSNKNEDKCIDHPSDMIEKSSRIWWENIENHMQNFIKTVQDLPESESKTKTTLKRNQKKSKKHENPS